MFSLSFHGLNPTFLGRPTGNRSHDHTESSTKGPPTEAPEVHLRHASSNCKENKTRSCHVATQLNLKKKFFSLPVQEGKCRRTPTPSLVQHGQRLQPYPLCNIAL